MNNSDYRQAVNTANYHNYRYFVLASPVIDDIEFDTLYFQIQEYERQHPSEVLPDSPTQRVGSDLHSDSYTIPHRTPMLSTQKCNSSDAVLQWMQATSKRAAKVLHCSPDEVQYTVEWKYDGVSCSLVYQDGQLIEASTRGDHLRGLDILCHVRNIPSIPQTLGLGTRNDSGEWVRGGSGVVGRVEVRGEIIMPFDAMPQVKSYNDPRTAASAILRTLSETPYDSLLQFKPWQLIASDADYAQWFQKVNQSNITSLSVLYDNFGFDVEECDIADASDIEYFVNAYTDARKDNSFPTDGLVIKLENKLAWSAMGATEHHPKFCIAYKFAPLTAVTYCTAIEYTVGEKTCKVIPIAHFTPVQINGKMYSKCSLGSEASMLRLGIHEGSCIEIALRNDVNAQINKVL